MARITVEDCIDKFPSRFELVLVASNRARKLHSGETPTVEKDNDKHTVIALREIAQETLTSEQLKNDLIEEYQTISPVDEEELSLEYEETEDSQHLQNTDTSTNETSTNETSTNDTSTVEEPKVEKMQEIQETDIQEENKSKYK